MRQEETALYRHYDNDNNLLYVGISLKPLQRLEQHETGSHWADKIARVTVDKFATRAEAEDAERGAIQFEKPQHNIIHAAPQASTAERKLRRKHKSRYSSEKVCEWLINCMTTDYQCGVAYGEVYDGRDMEDFSLYCDGEVFDEDIAASLEILCARGILIRRGDKWFLPTLGNYILVPADDNATSQVVAA